MNPSQYKRLYQPIYRKVFLQPGLWLMALMVGCVSISHQNATPLSAEVRQLRLVKRIQTEEQPKQVCFHPDRPEMYVTNLGGSKSVGMDALEPGSLQIFSLTDFQLLHREPARTGVECLLTAPDTLLYSDMFRDEIVYFKLSTRQVTQRVPVKEETFQNYPGTRYRFMPKIMILSPDEKLLIVSHWLWGLSIIDYPSARLIRSVPKFCEHPRGMLFSDNNTLHVMCYGVPDGEGQMVRLRVNADGSTEVISRNVTGGSPRHIVASDQPGIAYVSNLNSDRIYEYRLSDGGIQRELITGGQPNTIVLDRGGRYLYASLRGRDELAVIDTREWKVTERIHTGKYPTGLDVSPDGRWLAITNFNEASMDLYEIIRGPSSESP
ncbi:MAG: beta-propeller fold lactonase family protein [Leptospiraceae bacterium]|nr:beta-propeller fold lactonase family protein [Leptospiraceae bacterium]